MAGSAHSRRAAFTSRIGTGAPIVPVAITGTIDILPRGAKVMQTGQTVVGHDRRADRGRRPRSRWTHARSQGIPCRERRDLGQASPGKSGILGSVTWVVPLGARGPRCPGDGGVHDVVRPQAPPRDDRARAGRRSADPRPRHQRRPLHGLRCVCRGVPDQRARSGREQEPRAALRGLHPVRGVHVRVPDRGARHVPRGRDAAAAQDPRDRRELPDRASRAST